MQFTGSIGGLSGSFDVTVGPDGTLTGVATIKGQTKAAIKVENDPQIASPVDAMVLDVALADVAVPESKAACKGSQATGGMKKKQGFPEGHGRVGAFHRHAGEREAQDEGAIV